MRSIERNFFCVGNFKYAQKEGKKMKIKTNQNDNSDKRKRNDKKNANAYKRNGAIENIPFPSRLRQTQTTTLLCGSEFH